MNNVMSLDYHLKEWPKSLDPAHVSPWSKILIIIWNVVSVIIFPIGLCRFAYAQLRDFAFSVIAPGRAAKEQAELGIRGEKTLKDNDGIALTLHTPDGAKLSAAFYPRKHTNKAIIYIGGRRNQWERNKPEYLDDPSILMVNPRGFGKSTGPRSPEGYALDIYTAYKFLIEERKIDLNDIFIIGKSWGGAISTLGASLIQEEYPNKQLNIINTVSFADLCTEISMLCGRFFNSAIGLPAALAAVPMWLVAKVLSLEMNVKAAWDTLSGKKVIFYHPDDDIIPKEASLAEAVKEKHDRATQIYVNDTHEHTSPLKGNAERIFTQTLKDHFHPENDAI